jgi:signal peptidase II
MIYFIIAGSLLVLDLGIKWYAEKSLNEGETRQSANGKILLRKSHNSGMAMNLLENRPGIVKWSTAGLGLCLLGYYLYLLSKNGRKVEKTGWMLVLAGACSNLYDRFRRNHVVDYFSFRCRWKKIENIVFNLGDMFIFAGSILVIVAQIFRKK